MMKSSFDYHRGNNEEQEQCHWSHCEAFTFLMLGTDGYEPVWSVDPAAADIFQRGVGVSGLGVFSVGGGL